MLQDVVGFTHKPMRIRHENIGCRVAVGVEYVPGEVQRGRRPLSVPAKEQRTKNQREADSSEPNHRSHHQATTAKAITPAISRAEEIPAVLEARISGRNLVQR